MYMESHIFFQSLKSSAPIHHSRGQLQLSGKVERRLEGSDGATLRRNRGKVVWGCSYIVTGTLARTNSTNESWPRVWVNLTKPKNYQRTLSTLIHTRGVAPQVSKKIWAVGVPRGGSPTASASERSANFLRALVRRASSSLPRETIWTSQSFSPTHPPCIQNTRTLCSQVCYLMFYNFRRAINLNAPTGTKEWRIISSHDPYAHVEFEIPTHSHRMCISHTVDFHIYNILHVTISEELITHNTATK